MGIVSLLKEHLRTCAGKFLLIGFTMEVAFLIALIVQNSKKLCITAASLSIFMYVVGLIISVTNGFVVSAIEISSAIGCVLQIVYLRWLTIHGSKALNCWIETWAGFVVVYQVIQVLTEAYLKGRKPGTLNWKILLKLMGHLFPRFVTRAPQLLPTYNATGGGVRAHFARRNWKILLKLMGHLFPRFVTRAPQLLPTYNATGGGVRAHFARRRPAAAIANRLKPTVCVAFKRRREDLHC